MRLICPQCGAQYEIAAEMIPPEGRDVQCSNCATTWFQMPASAPDAGDGPENGADGGSEGGETGEDTLDAQEQDDADLGDGEAIDPAFAATAPPRRGPDTRVLEILREEREFNRRAAEAAARGEAPPTMEEAAEEDAPEPDPEDDPEAELEEDTPEARAKRERDRMAAAAALARARDKAVQASEPEPDPEREPEPEREPAPEREPEAGPPVEAAPPSKPAVRSSRADRLPEIGEVDGSAPPPPEANPDAAEAPTGHSGFRLGFGLAVLALAVALLLYVFGPRIGTAVPSLAEGLREYRVWVDGQRTTLARSIDALTDRMETTQ